MRGPSLRSLGLVALLASTASSPILAQTKTFALADRATITLPSSFVERTAVTPPPLLILAASAPKMQFSEFLSLEDASGPAIVKVGVSENPFFGSSIGELDRRMVEKSGMLENLFYFFFPPPSNCLAEGRSRWTAALRKHAEDVKKEEEFARGKDEKPRPVPAPAPAPFECQFGTATGDFFAQQLSTTLSFGDLVTGKPRLFYLPPLSVNEDTTWTWFVLEAQAQHFLDRTDVDHFGLPESAIGSRVHYFWAFGARTPFPFLRDPARKDLQLLHVAAALVSPNLTAAARFREILASVRVQ